MRLFMVSNKYSCELRVNFTSLTVATETNLRESRETSEKKLHICGLAHNIHISKYCVLQKKRQKGGYR